MRPDVHFTQYKRMTELFSSTSIGLCPWYQTETWITRMPAFQLTWTPSRLHTEKTVAQKMQYQPRGALLYHISKATIPVLESFLLTQHLVVSSRSNWLKRSLNTDTGTCDWVLDFLTRRQQTMRVGNHTSKLITVCTGSPQGRALSSSRFTLLICAGSFHTRHIIMFADDTTFVGLHQQRWTSIQGWVRASSTTCSCFE